MKFRNSLKISILLTSLLYMACGVRGDPVPPSTPPSLGRGAPNYKQATEGLSIPPVPMEVDEEDEEKK